MTYFRLACCCNDLSAMGVEPCVICRLPGQGERGCKVVLFGRKHAYNLSVRLLRSCVTITVVAENLDHSCVPIPLFETDRDDDRLEQRAALDNRRRGRRLCRSLLGREGRRRWHRSDVSDDSAER